MKTTVTVENKAEPKTKPMSEMQPCEVGVIVGCGFSSADGCYVMRTANSDVYEVMQLTGVFGKDNCWDVEDNNLKVRPLAPGEKLTITFEGE